MNKKITIITPTYNEEENVLKLIQSVKEVMQEIELDYIHLFIDNASTDRTLALLESETRKNPNIRIILNTRNYGQLISPYYALLNSEGDAAIILAADFEDPPEVIPKLISEWDKGFEVVCAVKVNSIGDNISYIRSLYYFLFAKIIGKKILKNFSGFGIYDRSVIDVLKNNFEPYPYLRGLIVEYGFNYTTVDYYKISRKKGYSKNSLYTLFDVMIAGIVLHVKKPLRILLFSSIFIFFPTVVVYDLFSIYNYIISAGCVNCIDNLFMLVAINLVTMLIISICIISEYISMVLQYVEKKPLVLERKRIGFE